MSDATRGWVLPRPADRAARYREDTRGFLRRLREDAQLRLRLANYLNLLLAGTIVALSLSISTLLPLARVDHVYTVLHDDGTNTTYGVARDIPKSLYVKQIKQAVWNYVFSREAFIYDKHEAQSRYDRVSYMSEDEVKKAYQAWFLDKKTGPQYILGDKGQIDVEPIAIYLKADDLAEVEFFKTVWKDGIQQKRSRVTAHVQFALTADYPDGFLLKIDDPLGVIVKHYQTDERPA